MYNSAPRPPTPLPSPTLSVYFYCQSNKAEMPKNSLKSISVEKLIYMQLKMHINWVHKGPNLKSLVFKSLTKGLIIIFLSRRRVWMQRVTHSIWLWSVILHPGCNLNFPQRDNKVEPNWAEYLCSLKPNAISVSQILPLQESPPEKFMGKKFNLLLV